MSTNIVVSFVDMPTEVDINKIEKDVGAERIKQLDEQAWDLEEGKMMVIKVDGTVSEMPDTHDLKELYKTISCSSIEFVTFNLRPFSVAYELICDEDGKGNGAEVNNLATAWLHSHVVGGVLNGTIIVRFSSLDYEDDDGESEDDEKEESKPAAEAPPCKKARV